MSGIKIGIGFGGGALGPAQPADDLRVRGARRGSRHRLDLAVRPHHRRAAAPRHRLRDGAVRGAHQAHQDGPERADAAGAQSGRGGAHLRDARLSDRRLRPRHHGGRARQRSARLPRLRHAASRSAARAWRKASTCCASCGRSRTSPTSGRFYQFENVTIEPRPARGPLDIWIGGRTDVALQARRALRRRLVPLVHHRRRSSAPAWRSWRPTAPSAAASSIRARPASCCSPTSPRIARAPTTLLQLAAGDIQAAGGGDGRALRGRLARGDAPNASAAYVDAGCTKFVLFPLAPPDELVAADRAVRPAADPVLRLSRAHLRWRPLHRAGLRLGPSLATVRRDGSVSLDTAAR